MFQGDFRMKRFALLLPIFVAACMAPPPEYEVSEEPSLEAIRALPPGVAPSQLRTSLGCYFYETADGMQPLMSQQVSGTGIETKQLCL